MEDLELDLDILWTFGGNNHLDFSVQISLLSAESSLQQLLLRFKHLMFQELLAEGGMEGGSDREAEELDAGLVDFLVVEKMESEK